MKRHDDSLIDSAYFYLERGCWHVSMSVDDDLQLTIAISNEDRTRVHEINEDLGEEFEWVARFTTDAIEEEYRELFQNALFQKMEDMGATPIELKEE